MDLLLPSWNRAIWNIYDISLAKFMSPMTIDMFDVFKLYLIWMKSGLFFVSLNYIYMSNNAMVDVYI